jgi:ParB family chromosome partitioning protein
MTALLHKLVSDTFQHAHRSGCLEASRAAVFFPAQAEDLKDSPRPRRSPSGTSLGADIPKDDQALWDWLAGLDDGRRLALLAHCVSYGVNALSSGRIRYSGQRRLAARLDVRLAQADRLARATGLDMVEAGWRPTVGNYLGRVTKPRILEAVREGAGEQAAQLIDHLKKGDMAKEAERLLADTGWLPEPLRGLRPFFPPIPAAPRRARRCSNSRRRSLSGLSPPALLRPPRLISCSSLRPARACSPSSRSVPAVACT